MRFPGILVIAAVLFLCLSPSTAGAGTSVEWEKFDGCTLAPGFADGDSFVVRVAPRTFRTFRLYFVDTPEDTADQRFPERIAEQAQYFGITPEQTLKLGDTAAEFTRRALSRPFVVWTCWQKAPGASSQQRYYAIVSVDGRWLSSMLVENGLARIYGKRISLPTGGMSRDYLDKLEALEAQAKALRLGGWR